MKVQDQVAKNHFEKLAWQESKYVCGIDEVGRGCLAGPVVVSAAIIPLHCRYPGLKDSKTMTPQEREKAFTWITKNCWYSSAIASHTTIDSHNIYKTTLLMMRKALLQLLATAPMPLKNIKFVLIDAMPLSLEQLLGPHSPLFYHMNYGEKASSSIAAASIVAKVTRDTMMTTMSHFFPAYHLNHHKGYATNEHIISLKKHGTSIIHRKTFIDSITRKDQDANQQQSLF